jgi:hypothetical protein
MGSRRISPPSKIKGSPSCLSIFFLSVVIYALAARDAFEKVGVEIKVVSASSKKRKETELPIS